MFLVDNSYISTGFLALLGAKEAIFIDGGLSYFSCG